MTLATRLLLLIALALMPPLLFGILNDVLQRNERAAALQQSALAETRSTQDNLLLITDGVHRLLVALAEAPAIRASDREGCSRYLKAVAGQLKEYSLLFVLARDGTIICNNEGPGDGSAPVSNRAYLRRALESEQFVSGDLVVSKTTRRETLHFAMPFRDMDGAPAGIVVASIDQQWLEEQLATETAPTGAQLLMIDPSGVIVAAAQDGKPLRGEWVGQPAPPALLEALRVPSPGVVEARGPDGTVRMFGAVPPNPALVGNQVSVGIDQKQAFSDLRAASIRNMLGLCVGALVALLAGIYSARRFVLGPLGRIAAAADRVGAGDLKARVDLGRHSGELRDLGAGFDRMIETLAAREQERDEAEAALRNGEARFQAIANCIDQMVWSTRPDGFHDYFNQRWYDYTGTSPGTSEGEAWIRLFHPDDHEETERIWRTSLATGQPYHREYRLRHVSGRYRWVLGRAQPIHDEQGRITRWYGTCTDIDDIVQARDVLARSREALTQEIADRTAELMAAEEKLRQSQKMEAVGQLTGGIAHDFNNMLQAIGGALELLVRRVEQNKLDDAKRFAGIARTTVDRAASLTHRLLAFARRQTLSPEPIDPAELVDGMSELVSRTVGPAIEFSLRHDSERWNVLCDLSQLENVVFNLCINARDAMPSGGKLAIVTRNVTLAGPDIVPAEGASAGEYVEIAVTDTGTGMDEATQAKAFEPFFTTKPLGQGTGLGLSQVYGFVRQSGGFVQLESQPGRGTTVRLMLPRHKPALATPEPEGAGERASILLVQAEAEVRQAAAHHLRTLGYRVWDGADGQEAMRLLEGDTARLDLLVTDVGLPGNLNGRQIAEMARHRRPGLPILFITFYGGALARSDLDSGMAIIAKPVTPEALAARIQVMLSQPAAAL